MTGSLPVLRVLSRSRMERGDADRPGPTGVEGEHGQQQALRATRAVQCESRKPSRLFRRASVLEDADEIASDRPEDKAGSNPTGASRQRPGAALKLSHALAIAFGIVKIIFE